MKDEEARARERALAEHLREREREGNTAEVREALAKQKIEECRRRLAADTLGNASSIERGARLERQRASKAMTRSCGRHVEKNWDKGGVVVHEDAQDRMRRSSLVVAAKRSLLAT